MTIAVLCAVFHPGADLPDFVTALPAGTDIVVVDDGSGPAYDPVLTAAGTAGATVLRLPVNRGKGAALKTGLRHLAGTGHDVVCADPDGQHHVRDIVRVAERLRETGNAVLGVRSFEGDVPLRSRIGNTVTSRLFRTATGHDVRDTQTGLRGFPARLLPRLIEVPGDRFDYEMAVLLDLVHSGEPVEQVAIATSYLDDNAGSHFGSVSDSIRVYRPLVRRAVSSLIRAER